MSRSPMKVTVADVVFACLWILVLVATVVSGLALAYSLWA